MSKVERNCYGGLLKIFDYSILPGYIKYLSVGELCIFLSLELVTDICLKK